MLTKEKKRRGTGAVCVMPFGQTSLSLKQLSSRTRSEMGMLASILLAYSFSVGISSGLHGQDSASLRAYSHSRVLFCTVLSLAMMKEAEKQRHANYRHRLSQLRACAWQ